MNTLLLGNLHWPDFLREGLDPLSWSEKEKKKVKQRYVDCDVKVCFLWNTPFKFLSLLYTFLNFTPPIAKEKEIHSSNVFAQLWYQITLQRLWAITGIIRDCGLWWKVRWSENRVMLMEQTLASSLKCHGELGILLLWVTGPEDWGQELWMDSTQAFGPVSLWSRGTGKGLQTEWGRSDIPAVISAFDSREVNIWGEIYTGLHSRAIIIY